MGRALSPQVGRAHVPRERVAATRREKLHPSLARPGSRRERASNRPLRYEIRGGRSGDDCEKEAADRRDPGDTTQHWRYGQCCRGGHRSAGRNPPPVPRNPLYLAGSELGHALSNPSHPEMTYIRNAEPSADGKHSDKRPSPCHLEHRNDKHREAQHTDEHNDKSALQDQFHHGSNQAPGSVRIARKVLHSPVAGQTKRGDGLRPLLPFCTPNVSYAEDSGNRDHTAATPPDACVPLVTGGSSFATNLVQRAFTPGTPEPGTRAPRRPLQ